MPNVKNRRIVVEGQTYRWWSIGGDYALSFEALYQATRSPRLEQLRLRVELLPGDIERLRRPGLSIRRDW